jgi:hypothetical protein
MPKWHTDYTRDEDLWLVTCPYCKGTVRKGLLSEAVKAGLAHADQCAARAMIEAG